MVILISSNSFYSLSAFCVVVIMHVYATANFNWVNIDVSLIYEVSLVEQMTIIKLMQTPYFTWIVIASLLSWL